MPDSILNASDHIAILGWRLAVQAGRIEELEISLIHHRRLKRENTQLRKDLLAAATAIDTLLAIIDSQDQKLSTFRHTFRKVRREQ